MKNYKQLFPKQPEPITEHHHTFDSIRGHERAVTTEYSSTTLVHGHVLFCSCGRWAFYPLLNQPTPDR